MSAKQTQKSIEFAGYFSNTIFIAEKKSTKIKFKITPDQF